MNYWLLVADTSWKIFVYTTVVKSVKSSISNTIKCVDITSPKGRPFRFMVDTSSLRKSSARSSQCKCEIRRAVELACDALKLPESTWEHLYAN
jgi:hypothetical protein